jgi:hypothetical protein
LSGGPSLQAATVASVNLAAARFGQHQAGDDQQVGAGRHVADGHAQRHRTAHDADHGREDGATARPKL